MLESFHTDLKENETKIFSAENVFFFLIIKLNEPIFLYSK